MRRRPDPITGQLSTHDAVRLNSNQKQLRIDRLKTDANENLHRANKHKKKFLICALHCGEALLEIKDLVKHGEFQKWIEDNFDDSYPTAAVYMSIAKHWGDSRITEMREKGIEIDSIKRFHDVLRDKKEVLLTGEGGEQDLKKNDIVWKRYCKQIVSQFKEEVYALDNYKHWSYRYKVFMLGGHFHYFWGKLHAELKKLATEAEQEAKKEIEKTKAQTTREKMKIERKAIKDVADKKIYSSS
ncbi:MAG TPA: DUF3102 domain-containing protein [Desulfosporosinus sp.]|nr:DUF3102 domain-containing protein [Desulfosporosinus sp.]